jgi:glycosyltransferase involved in cell wall biosynthesis
VLTRTSDADRKMSGNGKERTRILVVIPTLEIGGAERQITLFLQRCNRAQYEPALACCSIKGELAGEVPSDVPVHDLRKRSRWDFPRLVLRLRKVILDFKPDIIMGSLEYGVLLAWCASRLGKSKGKVVARKEVMPSQSRLGEPIRSPKLWIDRFVRRRVEMIIAPSNGILDEIRKDLGSGRIPLVRIVNAVDLGRFRSVRTGSRPESDGKIVIVALGRMVFLKGFDLLLRAVASLRRTDIRLLLVGDGPERAALERLSAELGLQNVVRFVGAQAEPFGILEGADLGVVPSRFESFGNAIIEMFAAGIPVVAFDVDYGPREIIRNLENGLLVREVDSEGLAQGLKALLEDGGMRKRMAENAASDARRLYDIGTVMRRYYECFESLLAGAIAP